MTEKFKLTFLGGVGSVSGVNFLLEGSGKKILFDAGISNKYQTQNQEKNYKYNPNEIDYIFISHAHPDNSGKIPILVKDGFKGVIYSTPETKSLAEFIFLDCLESGLYDSRITKETIKKTMSLWMTQSFGTILDLGGGMGVDFFDAGSILGSAIINFNYKGKNLVFANALGSLFVEGLSGMDKVKKIDYLVMESVYGDKSHKLTNDRSEFLEDIIEDTLNRKGTVIFPISFVNKIYVILAEIQKLMNLGKIPKVPIIVNSPLTIKTAHIYSDFLKCGDKQCRSFKDIQEKSFDDIRFIMNEEDLLEADKLDAKIFLGDMTLFSQKMVVPIAKKYLQDPNSTIILVDYQTEGSLARELQEGKNTIRLVGNKYDVFAQVEIMDGYSSHADYNKLFKFVDEYRFGLKKTFVVIGEKKSSDFFVHKIKDNLGVNAEAPEKGDSYDLDF